MYVVPLAASMNSIFFKGEYDEIGICDRKEREHEERYKKLPVSR